MEVGFALTKDRRAEALVAGVEAGDHAVGSKRRAEGVDEVRVHDGRVNEGWVGKSRVGEGRATQQRLSDLGEVGVDLRVWWFEMLAHDLVFP